MTEPTEPSNPLPKSELNPLQNSLLAENMNRWAEVYFTNPPERRDEAVADLLRELEEEQRQRDVQPRGARVTSLPSRELSVQRRTSEKMVYCPSCGVENPDTHQFCGNCGEKIDTEKSASSTTGTFDENRGNGFGPKHAAPDPSVSGSERPAQQFREEMMEEEPSGEYYEEADPQEDEVPVYSVPVVHNDLSLFQSLRAPADVDEEEWEYGPQRSSSYRYYIAAALAIVILGLGYLAWKSAQSSQAANEASPPPPGTAIENAPVSTTPASAPKTETAPTSPAKNEAPDAASKTSAATRTGPEKQRPSEVVRASETRRIEPKAASASIGGGAEELATAQRYLSGTPGQGRDGAEAAKWLWKSIAKHNGQATLLLADLYLRGDGVSKNCEQGRVLLDSAAQRGVPGAGERLRNLPAFGCH